MTLMCLQALAGCGGDDPAVKAEEARQAERMQQELVERYQRQMEAAQQIEQQRLKEAERGGY
ncbi:MAG: hypothetical protein ACUVT2_08515 [Thiobacillaceae bacterium]